MASDDSLQIVIFRLHEEYYGVNIRDVIEIHKEAPMTNVPNSKPFIDGVINLRGKIVVIVDLNTMLNMERTEQTRKSRIIVMESEGDPVGMKVDEVIETVVIAKDDIQAPPSVIRERINDDYIQGIITIKDRLVVLLDNVSLFQADITEEVDASGGQ
ncbi:purine-binding chemotaxis protein CheW [Candidatus Woesearchaeota archaeon]|nr:purine-binding chemotaxis protein CheW [Candidatus Woesearchaeota archaeon]